jgi:carboxymethylenebutenolidase
MQNRLGFFAAAVAVLLFALYFAAVPPSRRAPARSAAVHATLPPVESAETVLNSANRHLQWVNTPAGFADIRAFIVYPDRSNKAPVVLVSASGQGASHWIRAVAVQVAADGFIAVVSDVLSGLGSNGGDTNAFPDGKAVAAALERLGPVEVARRTNAVREYAAALPSANGQITSLNFDASPIEASVIAPVAGNSVASFSVSGGAHPQAIAFLAEQTGDRPVRGMNPDVPEDHSAHIGMMMAQTPTDGRAEGRGFPKVPNQPASRFNEAGTLLNSKLHREFVDIPMNHVKLHVWVEYPEGEGKAPIVIVMEHAPGLDDWQRALADQLAQDGFIAIAPDLNSGMGPSGGNFDSFVDADAVFRSVARLASKDQFDRYRAARDWGMKLERANGRSASIGFCMNGGNTFRFAAEIPELDAAVSYYGNPSKDSDFSKIKAPVLAFYGEEDARVTSTLPGTQAAMKANGKSFESHNYPHITHGFVEYQHPWPKTIAFLKKRTI